MCLVILLDNVREWRHARMVVETNEDSNCEASRIVLKLLIIKEDVGLPHGIHVLCTKVIPMSWFLCKRRAHQNKYGYAVDGQRQITNTRNSDSAF